MKNFIIKIYSKIKRYFENKELDKLLKINKYIQKYIINDNVKNTITNNTSKQNYIWQLWLQGEENAPPIVKVCLDSVKKYCPKDYKIIVLNSYTINDYIEIDKNIQEKYKKGIIKNPHYSDYIRTCLLAKYGGIWIDATVLLTDYIPEEILNSNFFVFKNKIWHDYGNVPLIDLYKIFLKLDKTEALFGSSWFIKSNPQNPIMMNVKIALENYWEFEKTLFNYFLYHIFLSLCFIKNSQCREIFENMPSICNKKSFCMGKLLMDDYQNGMFESLSQMTSIHKLTYKLKIVSKKSLFEHILTINKGLNK